MEHTYDELKNKTVVQLREIAKGLEHEAVQGYTQLNKEHLLEALCKALNIDKHQNHHKVVGINKTDIKKKIKELKKKRDEILAGPDPSELKTILKKLHHYKRKIRKASI